MRLSDKQSKFTFMLARLLIYAESLGYQISMGDVLSHPEDGRHKQNSCHYIKLAADLNLFKNGRYLSETIDHEPLGLYWESMGGSWGGRFDDGNHYSLEHKGYR